MSGNASVGNSVEDWATAGISGTSQAASGQGLGAVVGLPNGNGSASTGTPYSGDTSQLGAFIASNEGQQFASSYNPTNLYAQVGTSIQSYAPGTNLNQTTVGQDVVAMMNAYNAWVAGNAQTQTNWANYAGAANANEGGEGDQTITGGPAQSQRTSLLGALANAGNPTTPTTGLGVFGASAAMSKNLKPVPPVLGTGK